MAINSIAAIAIDGDLADLSLPKRVDLPVDWKLAPVRSTALRQYGGQMLDGGTVGLRVKEGPLQGGSLAGLGVFGGALAAV